MIGPPVLFRYDLSRIHVFSVTEVSRILCPEFHLYHAEGNRIACYLYLQTSTPPARE